MGSEHVIEELRQYPGFWSWLSKRRVDIEVDRHGSDPAPSYAPELMPHCGLHESHHLCSTEDTLLYLNAVIHANWDTSNLDDAVLEASLL